MTDDYWDTVPSQDFTAEDFQLWLNHATPSELEFDLLTKKTYNRMNEGIAKYEKLAEEIPYEPECEPKVRYLGPLKLKVNL